MIEKTLLSVKKTFKHHGVYKTILLLLYLAANKIVYFKILKGIKLTVSDLRLKQNENFDYLYKWATEEELKTFYADMAGGIDFLRQAFQRGDHCYAIFDNKKLINYGWYSKCPTPLSKNLTIYFDNQYVYMYNGYTSKDYRGQRLHGIGMAKAFSDFQEAGHKGLLSYVDCFNFSSLSSCRKLGYKSFGTIIILRFFGHYIVYHSRGCQDYGFRVGIHECAFGKAEVFLTDKNSAL